jgi:hypothetical protein
MRPITSTAAIRSTGVLSVLHQLPAEQREAVGDHEQRACGEDVDEVLHGRASRPCTCRQHTRERVNRGTRSPGAAFRSCQGTHPGTERPGDTGQGAGGRSAAGHRASRRLPTWTGTQEPPPSTSPPPRRRARPPGHAIACRSASPTSSPSLPAQLATAWATARSHASKLSDVRTARAPQSGRGGVVETERARPPGCRRRDSIDGAMCAASAPRSLRAQRGHGPEAGGKFPWPSCDRGLGSRGSILWPRGMRRGHGTVRGMPERRRAPRKHLATGAANAPTGHCAPNSPLRRRPFVGAASLQASETERTRAVTAHGSAGQVWPGFRAAVWQVALRRRHKRGSWWPKRHEGDPAAVRGRGPSGALRRRPYGLSDHAYLDTRVQAGPGAICRENRDSAAERQRQARAIGQRQAERSRLR